MNEFQNFVCRIRSWSDYADRLKEAEHFGYLSYYTDGVYRITGERK